MSDENFLATIAKSKSAANRAAKGVSLNQLEKAIGNLSQAVKAAKCILNVLEAVTEKGVLE